MNDPNEEVLRRYTNIPSVIHLLSRRCLTLIDPAKWSDRNDSEYIRIYKKKKGLGTILALCFTSSPETYHHWEVFAPGPCGVRIEFHKGKLLEIFNAHKKKLTEQQKLRLGDVKYRTIDSLRKNNVSCNDLPFTKRWPYEPESEFRIILEDKNTEKKTAIRTLDIPIDLSCIRRIVLSGKLDKVIKRSVVDTLSKINEDSNIEFTQTTLLENSEWKRHGEAAEC
jgi:hypothetical protein